GTAPGCSGWTDSLLLPVLSHDEGGVLMVRLLSDIAVGRLEGHARSQLLRARLVPVRKKAGGVRPVVISEVFVRLASLCAVSLLPPGTVASLLAPLQLGIGASNGVESALHTAQA